MKYGFPTSVGRDKCREKKIGYTEVQRTLVSTAIRFFKKIKLK